MSAVIQAQADIASKLDLEQLTAIAAEQAQALTGAAGAVLELAEGDTLVFRGVSGSAARHLGLRVKRKGTLAGECMTTGQAYRCDDAERDPRVDQLTCRRLGARSILAVPLTDWGAIVGVIKVLSPDPAAFGDAEVELLRILAGFIGAAIARAFAFEAASHGSMHDALTGLANRALLDDRLAHELSVAARTRQAIGIVFLDLNGFKQVNDTLGHRCGDCLLVEVARRLSRLVRSSDTLARLGGDEFVVLAPQLADPSALDMIVRRIRSVIGRPFAIGGQKVSVGVSVGTCYADDPRVDAKELLARADHAMYAEKRTNRNRPQNARMPAALAAVETGFLGGSGSGDAVTERGLSAKTPAYSACPLQAGPRPSRPLKKAAFVLDFSVSRAA